MSKWITTAIVEHFNDYCNGLYYDVLGTYKDDIEHEYAALSIDGPSFKMRQGNDLAFFTVNILCQIKKSTNIYKPEDYKGILISGFETPFQVLDSYDELIGCPKLESEIISTNFGEVIKGSENIQFSVEADFSLEIERN